MTFEVTIETDEADQAELEEAITDMLRVMDMPNGDTLYVDHLEVNYKLTPLHSHSYEIERMRQVARNVYEVWAGSEGMPTPETAAEAYLLRLVEQMRDEAKNGLYNAQLSRASSAPNETAGVDASA